MHKRVARKLKQGDIIVFGHSQWTADHADRDWQRGVVRRVTANGGIKLMDGRWVPYRHVLRQISSEREWQQGWRQCTSPPPAMLEKKLRRRPSRVGTRRIQTS
jgi:hypothetical protein